MNAVNLSGLNPADGRLAGDPEQGMNEAACRGWTRRTADWQGTLNRG